MPSSPRDQTSERAHRHHGAAGVVASAPRDFHPPTGGPEDHGDFRDDYTIGFEVSSPRISVNEQRVRDAATRDRLHEFFRSLPGDRFPALIALGEHVWLDNRDERFAAGINALVDGLEQIQRVGFHKSV